MWHFWKFSADFVEKFWQLCILSWSFKKLSNWKITKDTDYLQNCILKWWSKSGNFYKLSADFALQNLATLHPKVKFQEAVKLKIHENHDIISKTAYTVMIKSQRPVTSMVLRKPIFIRKYKKYCS